MQRGIRGLTVIAAIKPSEQRLERVEPRLIRMIRRFLEVSIERLQIVFIEVSLQNLRVDTPSPAEPQESVLFRELDPRGIQTQRDDLQLRREVFGAIPEEENRNRRRDEERLVFALVVYLPGFSDEFNHWFAEAVTLVTRVRIC